MKLSDQQFEFAKDSVLLEQWMINHGYKFTYGETWRPEEMQEIYYKTGRSRIKEGGPHGIRLAKDYNIWVKGRLTYEKQDLQEIGDFWESLNPELNRWGGNFISFIDAPHFERQKK